MKLIKVIFLNVILVTIFHESELAFSMVRGRSQSTGAIPRTSSGVENTKSHLLSGTPFERAQSESMGSISSFSTFSGGETLSRPELRTNEFRDVNLHEGEPIERGTAERDSFGRERNDRDPLIAESRRVHFAPNVDMSSVSAATHHGMENLNPARDGVFARVRSILFPAAVGVGVGAAVGAGSVVLFDNFNLTKGDTNELTTMGPNDDANGLKIVFR